MRYAPLSSSATTPPSGSRPIPGLLLAGLGAAGGYLVHLARPSVSAHVVAVVVGVALANCGLDDTRWRPGLRVASRRVLRFGIALLGARLSIGEVAALGPRALVAVVAVVAVTFVGTRRLGRLLGVSEPLSMLVATGYSICGASAIAAAEPFSDASEEDVAYALALVTLCGTLAIGVLPAAGAVLGLTDGTFGAWVGASVHDVGQVVAAASTGGPDALHAAVLVKLTRVACLAPLLAVVALGHRRSRGATASVGRRPPVVPLFLAGFLAAAAVRSTGLVPAGTLDGIRVVETLAVGAGLVGLGSGVVVRRLRALGGKPLVLGLASWALIGLTSLVTVRVLAIG